MSASKGTVEMSPEHYLEAVEYLQGLASSAAELSRELHRASPAVVSLRKTVLEELVLRLFPTAAHPMSCAYARDIETGSEPGPCSCDVMRSIRNLISTAVSSGVVCEHS